MSELTHTNRKLASLVIVGSDVTTSFTYDKCSILGEDTIVFENGTGTIVYHFSQIESMCLDVNAVQSIKEKI